MLHINLQE